MEAEYIKRLGELYRASKAGDNPGSVALVEKAMDQMLVAEAAMTTMMVAESLALETLRGREG